VANANATIADNKVLSIRDSSYSGCQNGVAIRYGSQAFGYAATGTASNNIVADFQKGGIVVDGLNTNVTVTGNTVTGQNTPGINGQNGIEVARNAKGTVSNNTVSNAAYFIACPTNASDPNFALCNQSGTPVGPKNSSAAGILLYDVNGGVTVSNNTVTGSDIGIWVGGDGPNSTNGSTNVLLKGNTVSSNRAAGIFIDTSSTSIQIYSNSTHLNGKDALNNITGFVDSNFAQGYGYDLVDENTNEFLNDWGYSGAPGAAPNSFDTNWGNGKGLLLNY
jgi:parallel beta-helix repeat protein